MADVNKQTEEMLSPDDMMLDSEPVTNEQLVEAGKDLGQFALESTPIVGEAIIAKDISENISEGDYLSAGLNTAALGVGALPIVGDVLNKPLRAAAKKFSKADTVDETVDTMTAAGLTDADIKAWRRPKEEGGNATSEDFRKSLKGRNPILIDLANARKANEITAKEYREAADAFRPIRTVQDVPEPATTTELVSALGKKSEKGVLGVNRNIPDGDRITARLDINAYTDYDVWIPTLTHPDKKTMYSPTVVLRDVSFIQPDDKAVDMALNVATGKSKAPFAVMEGNYQSMSNSDAFKYAKDVFDDASWTQVGYDPTRRGFFYDRKTGEPVLNAEEVVQVGHLVLAKNAVKGNADDFLFNEGGVVPMKEQTKPLFSRLFRPEVNLSGETTSKNIDFGELNNEPLKAELKQKNLFGRVGFTGTTENNTSYGLGANLTSNKGTITTPKELREYGVPEKIEFGSGKLKANSYDGFLALQDIFGVEGLEARIDAGYTPLEYEKDLKKLALNFKYKFNEGGMAIEKQMEIFEDGGLMQEGGTVDPVSGNDVPVGSTQEEVRDDIPAQLSEGEFVFPADVVRFYGLEKLMEMRQRAKAGLQMMEDMGQMGNSEEATLPDDIPFDLEDLDIEDEMGDNNELEMQVGGFVQPQGFTGIQSTQPSQFQNYQPQYVPYQAPVVNAAYQPPQQQAVPTIPTGQLPQAEQFLQAPQPGEQDLRKYVNDEGQVRMIPFVNDQPVYPIPQGFYPEAEKPVEEEAPTAVTTETARVREGGGRDTGDVTPSTTDVTGIGYDRSSLTDSLRGVIDDYGFGFAALGETMMKGSSLNIIGNLFNSDPKVGINNLNSAMLGGVIDNYRGGTVTYSDPSRPGIKTGDYSINTPLDKLDPAQQDFLADVATLTAKDLQSIFTDEEGKPKTASEVTSGMEDMADTLGISLTLEGTNISKSKTTLLREIAKAVAAQKKAAAQQKQLDRIAEQQRTQAPSEAQAKSQPDRGPGGSYGDRGNVDSAGGKGGYSGAAGAGSFEMSPRAKGGLIEKPKPKKMKRGGLASKK